MWDNYAYFPDTWWSAVTIQSHIQIQIKSEANQQFILECANGKGPNVGSGKYSKVTAVYFPGLEVFKRSVMTKPK